MRYNVGQRFVAVTRAEADRLAAIERQPSLVPWCAPGTPLEEYNRLLAATPPAVITETNAELLHIGLSSYGYGTWAYWSDGVVTTSNGIMSGIAKGLWPAALAPAADVLIGTLRGSDSGHRDSVPWSEIASIVEDQVVSEERRICGFYEGPSVDRHEVRLRNGTTRIWWTRSVGYCEGYAYDLYQTRTALNADRRKDKSHGL